MQCGKQMELNAEYENVEFQNDLSPNKYPE